MSYLLQVHALVDHVRSALSTRGVAADVIHGPETVEQLLPVARAQIHFYETGDTFDSTMQARARGVATQIYSEMRAVLCVIRCTSTETGGGWRSHTALAEVLRDEVLRGLRSFRAPGGELGMPRRGEYDLEIAARYQVQSGAIYRLELEIGAGIYDVAPQVVRNVLAAHTGVLDRS